MFGWGENDRTTKEERAAWKDRAQQQMNEQAGRTTTPAPEPTGDDAPSRHARRKGLFD